MEICKFEKQYRGACLKLFFDTVRHVNLRDYSQSQVEAWAPDDMQSSTLGKKLDSMSTYVALNSDLIGFVTLDQNRGVIENLYVHKNHQGEGIASSLITTVEKEARSFGYKSLRSNVSITARPFFELKGYRVIATQSPNIKGVEFQNYLMEKRL